MRSKEKAEGSKISVSVRLLQDPPLSDGYSGEGFLETLEDIECELEQVKNKRGLRSRYMQNGPEKKERLNDLDQRIAQLEHLLKKL